ncbi:MAG: HPr family phosphocarrier protein [Spirochaetales bacterium]|nr:HPr family phosphocarrier protein [Spirochaetales bacterium]
MTEREVTITNRAGIHARPAALIVQTAGKFASRVHLKKGGDSINAKSIMGILTLGASYGTPVLIAAEGPDEEAAVEALARLFESRFEEE